MSADAKLPGCKSKLPLVNSGKGQGSPRVWKPECTQVLSCWHFLRIHHPDPVPEEVSTIPALSLACHGVLRIHTNLCGLSSFKMRVKCFSPLDLRIVLNIKGDTRCRSALEMRTLGKMLRIQSVKQ